MASLSDRAQALHYRQQVEALFDDYAPDFEASLLSLGYDIPGEIVRALTGDAGEVVSRTTAVDLGCGTGLAGAQLMYFGSRGSLCGPGLGLGSGRCLLRQVK